MRRAALLAILNQVCSLLVAVGDSFLPQFFRRHFLPTHDRREQIERLGMSVVDSDESCNPSLKKAGMEEGRRGGSSSLWPSSVAISRAHLDQAVATVSAHLFIRMWGFG